MIRVNDIVRTSDGSSGVVTKELPLFSMVEVRFAIARMVIDTTVILKGDAVWGDAFGMKKSYTTLQHTRYISVIGRVTKWKSC